MSGLLLRSHMNAGQDGSATPDPMKDWVAQAKTGRYSNASNYVRDLIGRDQVRTDKIAEMQRFVDDGIESGVGSHSADELFAVATARAQIGRGRD